MKQNLRYFLLMLACTACTQTVFTPSETVTCRFADSTAFASVHIAAEFPATASPASNEIRGELTSELINQVMQLTEKYDVNLSDVQNQPDALVDALGRRVLGSFLQLAQRDAEDRAGFIRSNEELSEEEKAVMLANPPRWEGDVAMRRIDENEHYIVYLSENYVYLGGAHGGVTGAGHLTFDSKTGLLFTRFLDDDAESALQPALRKGLQAYFTETEGDAEVNLNDLLFTDHGWIPLPEHLPYPTEEGLVFTYQQYEIAPYAAGMPSFTIPYDVLMPYLTQEAVKLLGLKK